MCFSVPLCLPTDTAPFEYYKEDYILEKINKANITTKLEEGYSLPIGARVKVYNEKNVLGKRRRICNPGSIEETLNSLYRVKINYDDGSSETALVPRYKLEF